MLSEIKQSLFDRLEANTAYPIYYKNVGGEPTAAHIRPFVIASNTHTIGLNDLGQEKGIFQINCYVKKKNGQLEGTEMAEEMLAIFPRNTELTGVRIDEYGSIGPTFFNDGWQITPVIFKYQNLID